MYPHRVETLSQLNIKEWEYDLVGDVGDLGGLQQSFFLSHLLNRRQYASIECYGTL